MAGLNRCGSMAVDKEGRHTARGFEPASMIMDYIREERQRCAELVKLIRDDHAFLIQCIENGMWPDELEIDPLEDLM